MILTLKIIFFFLGLWSTISLIEDAIEKIIIHTKQDGLELHQLYTHGLLSTFNVTIWILSMVFWTGFYLVNQL
jgi:hypothetical protein